MPSAATIVESEVRELVRRRGLDPAVQSGAVRALVEEVVADYADRAVTSSLPPLVDAGSVGRSVFDAIAGFGPLQPLLDDVSIEEVRPNARPLTDLGARRVCISLNATEGGVNRPHSDRL